mgnify:CR=1 FL=1
MAQKNQTKNEVNSSLSRCDWFEGKKKIYQDPGIFEFLNLIGQLRFQQRWTATARIPQPCRGSRAARQQPSTIPSQRSRRGQRKN